MASASERTRRLTNMLLEILDDRSLVVIMRVTLETTARKGVRRTTQLCPRVVDGAEGDLGPCAADGFVGSWLAATMLGR